MRFPQFERMGRRVARRIGYPPNPRLLYVTPTAGWSNDWDAAYITSGVRSRGMPVAIHPDALAADGDIVHFGSTWSLLDGLSEIHSGRNSVVATIFHGDRSADFPDLAKAMDRVLGGVDKIDVLITSCELMARRFRSWGVDPAKLRTIPLGVDLEKFKPADLERRAQLRHDLGISDDTVCLASFQKDGSGWGEGLEPKLIKGPDLFVEAAARLNRDIPNFMVLLTGPARGYVKRELERRGIPFRHDLLADYYDVVSRYQVADLYMVTSREEGGPKAVLEAMACGLPIVSTRVGMAPDVVRDGYNGFLADIDDLDTLVERGRAVLGDMDKRRALIAAGLETAQAYAWDAISGRYVDEVYRPLLQRLM